MSCRARGRGGADFDLRFDGKCIFVKNGKYSVFVDSFHIEFDVFKMHLSSVSFLEGC